MFSLSEEHVMLRDAARAFVQDKLPTTRLRALRDSGAADFDREVWAEISAMGWTGVLMPEDTGGSALGYVAIGLVLEELGRTLAPAPLLSAGLIGPVALASAAPAARARLSPKVLDGSAIIALAVDETPHHGPHRMELAAEQTSGGWRLRGRKLFVADGHIATDFVVAARTSGRPGDTEGVTLFLAPASAAAVTRLATVDSRGAANLVFGGSVEIGADSVLGEVGSGAATLEALLDRARAGLAAEMLGQAQAAYEMTVDYLKTRVQFGQSIGTFQALQHRAAKMFIKLELTRSAVYAALAAFDAGRADASELTSLAKALASETLHLVSNETVQMHGGIGMTDAHDAGLYLKRARVVEALYGSASFHRDRYARLSGY